MTLNHHAPRARAALALLALAAAATLLAPGCSTSSNVPAARSSQGAQQPGTLAEVARSDGYQWTGVAISRSGRVFASYPRWNDPMRWSVVEVRDDGEGGRVVPYPDAAWQSWNPRTVQPLDKRWVCVQSVHVDALDRLWVLDPGSPKLAGVVPGAAKLVQFNLRSNTVARTYAFDDAIAPKDSYLNDVRVDTRTNTAYMTDSGLGALVVLDLTTGVARRVLADHPSTKAEPGFIPLVGGRELRFPDGHPAQIHADGIALSPDGAWIYYQPICARTLYRVPTSALRDPALPADVLAAKAENLGQSPVTDGMEFDDRGNLYLTALEHDAIMVRKPDGTLETLVTDPRLAWPDTLTLGPNDTMLVSTAQIHRTPWFSGSDQMPRTPYMIFAFRRAEP